MKNTHRFTTIQVFPLGMEIKTSIFHQSLPHSLVIVAAKKYV
jgi:hypothetical protein